MSKNAPLALLELDPRALPAVFGVPWPDPAHLTLSFAPDGTAIGGAGSSLFRSLGGDTLSWQYQILRAFQTWAVNANVNIGLVADGGQPFSTPGPAQGDPNYGDVRAGARPLGGDVLAVTAPYSPIDVFSGRVMVNAAQDFGPGGYDLYTALLQEAGHALGIGNSADPASPMYEFYRGVRDGLTAGDIASLQALYGARRPDPYEGPAGNNDPAHAAWYSQPLEADIATPRDVDTYRFIAPLSLTPLHLRLQAAGLSLLAPRVTVLGPDGKVLQQFQSVDPLHNDLDFRLPQLRAGQTYYIQVGAARADVFGVGSYRLAVTEDLTSLLGSIVGGAVGTVNGLMALPDPETVPHSNDNRQSATILSPTVKSDGTATYVTRGVLSDKWDVDYYRIQAPRDGSAALVVHLWGAGGKAIAPESAVYSADGALLPSEVLVKDDGTCVLQVSGVGRGQLVYVKAGSGTGQTGEYTMSAEFLRAAIPAPTALADKLTGGGPGQALNLSMPQSDVLHLVLGATGSAVTLTIRDASGAVVASVTSQAGDARSLDIALSAGQYAVTITAAGPGPAGYRLASWFVTDPIGTPASNPNSSSSSTPGTPGWTSGQSTYTGPSKTTSQPGT